MAVGLEKDCADLPKADNTDNPADSTWKLSACLDSNGEGKRRSKKLEIEFTSGRKAPRRGQELGQTRGHISL